MLRKIITIKNVSRFAYYNASGDVELKRYNLVFAENARGKTTLCAILRSLQSGDAAHLIGRTTLGAADAPEIKILLNAGATATFSDGTWSATLPELAIFDSVFVSENVHSGDVVDIDHRRNLYSVIVGKRGVDLAKQIDDLDGETRAKSTEIQEKAAAVQALALGLTVEAFTVLAEDSAIDDKIATKEKELEAVKQAAQIKTRTALGNLALPESPGAAFAALLDKTQEGIAADAEQRVSDQIKAHSMGARGQAWLSEGLQYIHDTAACPFCSQSLDAATALIGAYKTYFSEAYNALRSEINAMRRHVDAALSDREIASLERIVDQNTAAAEFWTRFCEITAPVLQSSRLGDTLRALRQAALALLDHKAAAPLDRITIDAPFIAASASLSTTQQAVGIYNKAVITANALITSKKAATQAADVRKVETELLRLRVIKKRHEPEGKKACDDYATAQQQKKAKQDRKAAVREELDEYTERVIGRYEQTINQLLKDFHAGFRVTGTKHGYPGGVASSTYQILINDTPVELGDAQTPIEKPSFRNTLSAGDKSTLALAFFLAQLAHDPNKASRIVIFDDPFSSQDSFRRECTVQKIKKCGQDCEQVIVLSHDLGFLKRVWDQLLEPADRKCLTLTRIDLFNTTIRECDIEKETQATYKADREMLRAYCLTAQGNPRDVVQKIRPVLEAYCKLLGAGVLVEVDTLGVIVDKIRSAGTAHQLFPLCDKLEELNIYTRRYHHGESPGAATENIDNAELQGYVALTLDMTGGS
jgi:wobble nucleotide-excising tRNase